MCGQAGVSQPNVRLGWSGLRSVEADGAIRSIESVSLAQLGERGGSRSWASVEAGRSQPVGD